MTLVDLPFYRALMCISCALYILSHFIDCVLGGCNDDNYGLSKYTARLTYVSSPVSAFGTIFVLSTRSLQVIFERSLDGGRARLRRVRNALNGLGVTFAVSIILYLCVPYAKNEAVYQTFHTGPVVLGYLTLTIWLLLAVLQRKRSRSRDMIVTIVVALSGLEVFAGVESLFTISNTGFAHFLAVIELCMIALSAPLIIYATRPLRKDHMTLLLSRPTETKEEV